MSAPAYPVSQGALLTVANAASINDLDNDDPITTYHSDREPLTGRIQPDSASGGASLSRGYLSSQIPGEDRRATLNTLEESVWHTVRRDLVAVWEKMRLVLWPKYLLGGMLTRQSGGVEGGEGLSGEGLRENMHRLMGQWPNPEIVLEGGLNEGLRDWDLWFVLTLLLRDWMRCLRDFYQGSATLLPFAEHVFVDGRS